MALSTDTGAADGMYINDCFGTQTQTAGTIITRVVPPQIGGVRACIGWYSYDCSTTAHTLTFLVPVDEVAVASDAASGQAVVNINRVPTSADGSVIANTDFFVLQHEAGDWAVYKVSSAAGLAITMTANLSQKVLKSSKAFFMGQPSDHPLRQFTMKASTVSQFIGGDFRIRACTTPLVAQPILVHSDNSTAAGFLTGPAYYYD